MENVHPESPPTMPSASAPPVAAFTPWKSSLNGLRSEISERMPKNTKSTAADMR